jgi:hypothetical protein
MAMQASDCVLIFVTNGVPVFAPANPEARVKALARGLAQLGNARRDELPIIIELPTVVSQRVVITP